MSVLNTLMTSIISKEKINTILGIGLPMMVLGLEYNRFKNMKRYEDLKRKNALSSLEREVKILDISYPPFEFCDFVPVQNAYQNAIPHFHGKEREKLENIKDQSLNRMIQKNFMFDRKKQ